MPKNQANFVIKRCELQLLLEHLSRKGQKWTRDDLCLMHSLSPKLRRDDIATKGVAVGVTIGVTIVVRLTCVE